MTVLWHLWTWTALSDFHFQIQPPKRIREVSQFYNSATTFRFNKHRSLATNFYLTLQIVGAIVMFYWLINLVPIMMLKVVQLVQSLYLATLYNGNVGLFVVVSVSLVSELVWLCCRVLGAHFEILGKNLGKIHQ